MTLLDMSKTRKDVSLTKGVSYPSLFSVKISDDLATHLDNIKLFEHRKLSELIREWLSDKVEGYLKRPDYRHFLKGMEERKQKRMRELEK